jgi:alginate O-acetyltransferase complex protein AlgI
LLASYVFYGSWNWKFLSLIFISTFIDYYVSHGIALSSEARRRKVLLAISVIANLGMLGIFKYYNFFIGEFLSFADMIGITVSAPVISVALPVGISFYTFQTMSYTIDVYRRQAEPEKNFSDFALYVCFFPQLVAGPIERFSHLMPQIRNPRKVCSDNFAEGFYHILIGLFKKVVIADNMAPIANSIFSASPEEMGGANCLLGIVAFTFQIYGDFSGYSSMAQGVAKWLGFDLMYNFKMPYFANSPSDFWRRWHISLSGWLRDYVYIPLGGNRRNSLFTIRNLMITMLLGGLWHGAGWTFVLWGCFHGLILCIYRPYEQRQKTKAGQPLKSSYLLSIPLMFSFTMFGWLLFRADSINQVADFVFQIATSC